MKNDIMIERQWWFRLIWNRGGVIILMEKVSTCVAEEDEIDLEFILELMNEGQKEPVYNSFLDTDEKTPLSAKEMQQEEFGGFSYMANNRRK